MTESVSNRKREETMEDNEKRIGLQYERGREEKLRRCIHNKNVQDHR